MNSRILPDTTTRAATNAGASAQPDAVVQVLAAIAFTHALNDLIQAMLPALYPMLKTQFTLNFTQVGLITLIYQCTASLLQPAIGLYTDRKALPFLLPLGACFTLAGVLMLALVDNYNYLLIAAALIGVGSSTFHPEASRVARLASGGRYGFAQAMFQVGGNVGAAFGPLLAAVVIVGRGQGHIAWFGIPSLLAIPVLIGISRWHSNHLANAARKPVRASAVPLPRGRIIGALCVLAMLVFSKYVYMTSLSTYYTFYLIDKFGLSTASAQLYLFLFLGAVAVGTFLGGPLGDRIGRKRVIWLSILGAAPFTLALPYVDLFWTGVLTVLIGLVISSAFSSIVVFAQELVPGKVGLIGGIFFGLMFGVSGIGAAAMGHLADVAGIATVYKLCSFLPLLGLLTALLPDIEEEVRR